MPGSTKVYDTMFSRHSVALWWRLSRGEVFLGERFYKAPKRPRHVYQTTSKAGLLKAHCSYGTEEVLDLESIEVDSEIKGTR